MSLDDTDLLKVVESARNISERSGFPLDTEIIAAQYNVYRSGLGRPFNYQIREMQSALDRLIQDERLDGHVTRVSGEIVKVVVL